MNCQLRSVRKDKVKDICKLGSQGKQRVSAEVAAVWSLSDIELVVGQELLLDYGPLFWNLLHEPEHCALCFSRTTSDDDQMVPVSYTHLTLPTIYSV